MSWMSELLSQCRATPGGMTGTANSAAAFMPGGSCMPTLTPAFAALDTQETT